MVKTPIFEIQVVDSAFSGKIPAHLWRRYGTARTTTGAVRSYNRAYKDRHQEQNSWSGHVRLLVKGIRVPVYTFYAPEMENYLSRLLRRTPEEIEAEVAAEFGN